MTTCSVCGKLFSLSDLTPGRFVRPLMFDRILTEHPGWNADAYICHEDLNHYRSLYVQDVLEQERGELSTLEREVVESLRQHDVLTQNLNDEADEAMTFGQQLADKVATFGGSWTFILIFRSIGDYCG